VNQVRAKLLKIMHRRYKVQFEKGYGSSFLSISILKQCGGRVDSRLKSGFEIEGRIFLSLRVD